MQYNVAQLLKEPVGATREYEIEESPNQVPDVPAVAPYVGKARLVRLNQGVLVEVEADTTVRLTCGRCLTDFVQPLRFEFTEEYRPTVDLTTGTPVAAEPGDDRFTIDEYHTLDLTEAIRQYALVALPLWPICREDCLGLCPICGRDRNVSPCEHEMKAVDPRLAVLERLLREDDNERR
ncbi:MAG: YceD family protein [Chloroflexota bacterium]